MNNRRGEYTKLTGIELVELTRAPMSRDKALRVLGLSDMPSPLVYEEAVKNLLAKHKDELSKRAEIHTAHNRLLSDHQFAVENMRSLGKRMFVEYQGKLPGLKAQVKGHSGDERLLITLGKQLDTLNNDYCSSLEKTDADAELLTIGYSKTFIRLVNNLSNCLVNKEVVPEFRGCLEQLGLDLTAAYEQTKDRNGSVHDSVEVFKAEYQHYLGDILKLRDMEIGLSWEAATNEEENESLLSLTRYQDDLQNLHAKLKQLGDHYFAEIGKPDADAPRLQKEFNRGFKHIVADAKKNFAKEPGIWTNLHIALKILLGCTMILALIILACEKPEDRNRLFTGPPKGELNIHKIWNEWEMDIFPDPGGNASKRGLHGM